MQRVREDFAGELGFGRTPKTEHSARRLVDRQTGKWPRNTRNDQQGEGEVRGFQADKDSGKLKVDRVDLESPAKDFIWGNWEASEEIK